MQQGVVLRSTGSWYEVFDVLDKKNYSCRLAGKLKLHDKQLTNPVAVGDEVLFSSDSHRIGTILEVLPRANYIARQSPKNRLLLHLIACNIDQAVLITTMVNPTLKPGFIDRFLLTTEPQNIPVVLVFNKSDLYEKSHWEELEALKTGYAPLTREILVVSTVLRQGIDTLSALLKTKRTLFSGQSGVGKSSLLKAIIPYLDIKTKDISSFTGKGTHTTTFAEMFPYGEEGFIIDTPGIKTLSFNNLEVMDVAHNFREFFAASEKCKFASQCTHRAEPSCWVRHLIEQGEIPVWRYKNYLNILDEIEAQKYWERNKQF